MKHRILQRQCVQLVILIREKKELFSDVVVGKEEINGLIKMKMILMKELLQMEPYGRIYRKILPEDNQNQCIMSCMKTLDPHLMLKKKN